MFTTSANVLAFIHQYRQTQGRPPMPSEIAPSMAIPLEEAQAHVRALCADGHFTLGTFPNCQPTPPVEHSTETDERLPLDLAVVHPPLDKSQALYDNIVVFTTRYGRPPTMRDMCRHTSMTQAAIRIRMNTLLAHGLIEWTARPGGREPGVMRLVERVAGAGFAAPR
jgi:hypothetical protein